MKEGLTILNKIRVHELSKELGLNPKELLGVLISFGADVKNHMSLVDEQYVNQVRKTYASGSHTVAVKPTTIPMPPQIETPAASPNGANGEPVKKPVPATSQRDGMPKSAQDQTKQRAQTVPNAAVNAKLTDGAKPPVNKAPASVSAVTPIQASTFEKKPTKFMPTAPNKPNYAPEQRPKSAVPDRRPKYNQPSGAQANQKRQDGKPVQRNQVDAQRGSQRTVRPQIAGRRPMIRSKNGRTGHRFGGANAPRALQPVQRSLELPSLISVKDLAGAMALTVGEVIKKLMVLGVLATINQEIDYETAAVVAQEWGIEVRPAPSLEDKLRVNEVELADDPESQIPRPPVVTVMGHVDHGKTSLLDAIKETNITAQEAGGITQHIGAYQVELKGRKITFLDTPGHEAFTAMRARGAQVTDMAILVVAADDGVMPQTIEAINHAKAAGIPIIVAINKIDKAQANADRVKQQLTEYGLVTEDWGGDTIMVEVSALKRTGLDHLLEMIILVADLKDLKANPKRPARGTIIESQLDKGHGPMATVLVQNGTLELGDTIIAGAIVGRVRALINDKGKRLKKATPSTPVEVIGLDGLPVAGDELFAIKDDHLARQVADQRQQIKRESGLKKISPMTLDELFIRVKEGELKELKIIVKADVHGSAEALCQSLERVANEQVKVAVIHSGVGSITESDVTLASASNAIVIGFNVRPDAAAKRYADKEQVDIRLYRVIYNAIEDIQAALEGMLTPEYHEVVLGRAEVRNVFKVPKVGNIAGSYVIDGKITRNASVRVLRDHKVIYEGKIDSLKRFKDDAREVLSGFECGIGLERFNDIKESDLIEAFAMEEIKRETKK